MKANLVSKIKVFFSKKRNVVIGGVALLVVLFLVISGGGNGAGAFEVGEAEVGDVISTVSVTGKVAPYRKADLGFDRNGIITLVNAKVGDIVREGDILLSIDTSEALASLSSAEANLAEVERGIRSEERVVESTKVKDAEMELNQEKLDAMIAVREALIKSDGIVRSEIDTFFDNPGSSYPTINIYVSNTDQEKALNLARLRITESYVAWRESIAKAGMNPDTEMISSLLAESSLKLSNLKAFFDEIYKVISKLSSGNSGLEQSDINALVVGINGAQTELVSVMSSLSTARSAFENAITSLELAKNEFSLKDAGSTKESIEAERARVREVGAQLSKLQIYSPMDGIVTKMEPERGEIVTAGSVVAGVMSDEVFKIEVNLPEADISRVSVGNRAIITLDSYGPDIEFGAMVTMIDPAETIVEGVPTYKVTLRFDEKDERVRSGMTANVNIENIRMDNVITVPSVAVFTKDSKTYVRVPDSDGKLYTEKEVMVGIRGTNGKVEILGGLNVGDRIVTFLKK